MIHSLNFSSQISNSIPSQINLLKFYLKEPNHQQIKSYESLQKFLGLKGITISKVKSISQYIISYNKKSDYNKKKFPELVEKYNVILKNLLSLSEQLNLSSALEYANLYTYLLWNGYLSKEQKLIYNSRDTMAVEGLPFLDIINGKGMCFNYSCFLQDFLNKAGFLTQSINNTFSKNLKNLECFPIKRQIQKFKFGEKIINLFQKSLYKFLGNHTFALIKDDSHMYIYDPTTLLIMNINNLNNVSVVNGEGDFQLQLLSSFIHANPDYNLIDDLVQNRTSGLSKLLVMDTWRNNEEIFYKNQKLIHDCYDVNKSMIDDIADKSKSLVYR